jgi:hypothetical protein
MEERGENVRSMVDFLCGLLHGLFSMWLITWFNSYVPKASLVSMCLFLVQCVLYSNTLRLMLALWCLPGGVLS